MNKHSKKIISAVLCIMLVFAFIPTAFASDFSGIGSKDNPYLITNAGELDLFAQKVASGENFDGKYFLLMNDIAVSSEFSPIGTNETAFEGFFNGNGKTISGIDVEDDYAGLFAFCNGAIISDLTVSGSFSAENYAGAVVAYAVDTVIENCVNAAGVDADNYAGGIVGYIASGRISGCSTTTRAPVSGYENYCGGIAGYSGADITECTNNAYISGNKNVGGIAGYVAGDIISCTNTANIVSTDSNLGGIAGLAAGEVKYCKNTGRIYPFANTVGVGNVGGIIGVGNNAVIAECLSSGAVSATGSFAGGIAGNLTNGSVTNCINVAAVSNTENFAGGIFGVSAYTQVSKCIFTSSVSAQASTDAAIGALSNGSITDCYYDASNESNAIYSGKEANATGLSSSSITIESAYPALDFENTWDISEAHALYPLLMNIPFHTLNITSSSQASCTEDGVTTGDCSICRKTVTTIAPAYGHTYKIVSSKAATCTTAGYEDMLCTICNESETTDIPATGHTDANGDSVCDICLSSTKTQPEKKNIFQRIADFFMQIIDWFRNLFK